MDNQDITVAMLRRLGERLEQEAAKFGLLMQQCHVAPRSDPLHLQVAFIIDVERLKEAMPEDVAELDSRIVDPEQAAFDAQFATLTSGFDLRDVKANEAEENLLKMLQDNDDDQKE